MAKLIDSAATIELTPYKRYPRSQWIDCIIAIDLHIQGKSFRAEFREDGGLLSLKECQELIQKARAYTQWVNDRDDDRAQITFNFDPLEGRFTIRMEHFDLPSDAELNHSHVIVRCSMTLATLDENSQTSLEIGGSFHTDHVMEFVNQFEQEVQDMVLLSD